MSKPATAPKLSKRQQQVLGVVTEGSGSISGPAIRRALVASQEISASTTVEGIHQTAASLVRHGLIVKREVRGIIQYSPASERHTAAVVAARKRYDEAATRVDRILARDALQRVLAGVR